MKKSDKRPARTADGPARDYHHGNLRSALLKAAFAQLKRHGLRALTLRELARKVGVTHAAPYHHFRDREALLEAMAEGAFEELAEAMRTATEGVSDPGRRLALCGQAYIDFAHARPERAEVMFRRAESPPAAATRAPDSAFHQLVQAVSDCQAAGIAPGTDPMPLALSAWSVVHGFAVLWSEGPLSHMEPYKARFEALRDQLLDDFVLGLAARAARSKASNHS